MTDRPFVQLLTAELRDKAKQSRSDFDVLHQVYVETLFRSRKPARELRAALAEELTSLQGYFRWPDTDAPAGNGSLDDGFFQYAKGLLGFVGYRVGASGVSVYKRHALLDHIYTSALPRINSAEYMAEWGSPHTATRLKKMAESLASFARGAKRNDVQRYAVAISEWESDLAYLKRNYYDTRYKFGWPRTAA